MPTDHTQFSVFPGPPPPQHTHTKGEKRSPICVAHILSEARSNSHWPDLRKTVSFPTGTPPEASDCGELHSNIPITIFESSLQCSLSSLILFSGGVLVRVVTEAFCVPLSCLISFVE